MKSKQPRTLATDCYRKKEVGAYDCTQLISRLSRVELARLNATCESLISLWKSILTLFMLFWDILHSRPIWEASLPYARQLNRHCCHEGLQLDCLVNDVVSLTGSFKEHLPQGIAYLTPNILSLITESSTIDHHHVMHSLLLRTCSSRGWTNGVCYSQHLCDETTGSFACWITHHALWQCDQR